MTSSIKASLKNKAVQGKHRKLKEVEAQVSDKVEYLQEKSSLTMDIHLDVHYTEQARAINRKEAT